MCTSYPNFLTVRLTPIWFSLHLLISVNLWINSQIFRFKFRCVFCCLFLPACDLLYHCSSFFSSSSSSFISPFFFSSTLFCRFGFFCVFFFWLCFFGSFPAPPPYYPCLLPSTAPSHLLPEWIVNRDQTPSVSTYPHSSSCFFSCSSCCSFWHPFDLLLLLWSPTSVPQPRRCPPLCPPRLGPCPSVQSFCPTQLAPPRGVGRSCADVWRLLLSGQSRQVGLKFSLWPYLPVQGTKDGMAPSVLNSRSNIVIM